MARVLVIGLLALAIATLVIGAMTESWWSYEDDQMSVSTGLRASQFCFPDRCDTTWLGESSHDERWVRAGVATYAAAFLCASLAFILGLTVLARRAPDLLMKTTLVAAVSTLLSGLFFVGLAPELYPEMSASYSMYSFLAGACLAIVGTALALRDAPPSEDRATGKREPTESPRP